MDPHASAMLDETVERNSERNGVTEGVKMKVKFGSGIKRQGYWGG